MTENWVWESLAESLRECPRIKEGFLCLYDKGYQECPIDCLCERKMARISEILHKIERKVFPKMPEKLVTESMILYLKDCLRFVKESQSGLHEFLRYCHVLIKLSLDKGDIEFLFTLGNPVFTLQLLIIIYPQIRNLGEYVSPEDNPW
jgi:hypothetical protein